jgi:hypothetical protein
MREILVQWGAFKAHMGRGLEVSQAMLHIHFGLALFLVARALLGGKLSRFAPLVLVTVLELANETMDFARYQVSGWPWTPWGTIGDVLNTLFWPMVLTFFLDRHRPAIA